MAKVQAPEWYKSIPAERVGYWSEGDNRMKLAGQATYGKQARLVLKDGTVIDGTVGEERNRWDPKHALADAVIVYSPDEHAFTCTHDFEELGELLPDYAL